MSELLLPLPVFGFYLSSGLGILRPSDLTVMGPAQLITGQGRSWAGSAAWGGGGGSSSPAGIFAGTRTGDVGSMTHNVMKAEGPRYT